MNFVISGLGYVGKATTLIIDAHLLFFHKQNSKIQVNDPSLGIVDADWESADWHFVCVPTPIGQNAEYDLTAVIDAVTVAKLGGFKGHTVIRSTVLPTDIDIIQSHVNSVIVWPEFLRKATWDIDALNPPISIAGGAAVADLVELFFKYNILTFDDAKAASMLKLASNSYLAMKTIVAHDITKACHTLGIDATAIQIALSSDPRLGNSHWQQPGPDGNWGYGGGCLPKDTQATATLLTKAGIDNNFANWADLKNKSIK